jgi:nucleoside-diphosphate-sugar epimerase
MKILLTGGSGDLGTVLAPQLAQRGDIPISFDVRPPQTQTAVYHHNYRAKKTGKTAVFPIKQKCQPDN